MILILLGAKGVARCFWGVTPVYYCSAFRLNYSRCKHEVRDKASLAVVSICEIYWKQGKAQEVLKSLKQV